MKIAASLFFCSIVCSIAYPAFAEKMCKPEPVALEAPDPRCAHRGEIGPCRALIESWHYDPVSNSCKSFYWGGCGEPKPFTSRDECQQACAWKGSSLPALDSK